MPRIFISYRRADSQTISGCIHDKLVDAFGDKNVFKDVDDIPPGKDFRAILHGAVRESDVMLVVIGRQWLNAADANGRRMLDDPNDFVRFEIEAGLRRNNMLVIPVLVHDAPMPPVHLLPPSNFHRDMQRLIEQIRKQSVKTQKSSIVNC